MRRLFICAASSALAGLLFSAGSSAVDLMTEAFGPVDAGDALGNGRLTVTFSTTGRIASVHWPSPGYFDQLTYTLRTGEQGQLWVPEGHGLYWAVRTSDAFFRELDDDFDRCLQGRPSVARLSIPQMDAAPACVVGGGGKTGVPSFFVHGERDLLVARFELSEAAPPCKVYWCANFTPCTRLLPEWPAADALLDYANDFAVFTPDQGQTIVHFRPKKLRGSDWNRARELLAEGGQAPGWQDFREGVWIAQSPDQSPTGYECGVSGTPSSACERVRIGALRGQSAAVGDCDSAFEFSCATPANGEAPATFTVYIAFGDTYAAAVESLDYARQKGYNELLRETVEQWQRRLGSSEPGLRPHERLLDVLLTCLDRDTGALVRMPLASPPLHMDIPRSGVMGAYALSAAGRHDLVRKRVDFYLSALRTQSAPGCPPGSIPAGLYADGSDAVPRLILDVEAVAWVLWLCDHHAAALPPEERAAFIEEAWPALELSAEFLAGWSNPRTGLPRSAFNPKTLRDDLSPELAIRTHMGLASALALAATKGQDRAEWRQRAQELETLIRARYLGADGFWQVERPERFWNISLVPANHPRWQSTLDAALDDVSALRIEPDRASELLFAALHIPPAQAGVKEKAIHLLESGRFDRAALPSQSGACVPDSYRAALQFLAWKEALRVTAPVANGSILPPP
ncbi:MAG: hypothetical protein ACOX5J_14395 [Candidatus Hydrogenedentales bacterium]|jgi:hypothetical protein